MSTTPSTYADVEKCAETPLRPWTDASTPDGVFAVTTRILGVVTNYFFTGAVGAPDAQIVGRVELLPSRQQNHYIGTRLKGGEWVGREAFAQHLSAMGA